MDETHSAPHEEMLPSSPLKPTRPALGPIAEAISIATASAFLVSAVLLAWAMFVADLPFARLVSIEDIVIQGLELLAKALAIALIVTSYEFIQNRITSSYRKKTDTWLSSRSKWTKTFASIPLAIIFAVPIWYLLNWNADLKPDNPSFMSDFGSKLVVSSIWAGSIQRQFKKIRVLSLIPYYGQHLMSALIIASVFLTIGISSDIRNGVGKIDQKDFKCKGIDKAIVLWRGTNSVAARCGKLTFIIANPENLTFSSMRIGRR